MAKREVPELVKYVIDNSNALSLSGSLKDFKKGVDDLVRVVESASDGLDYFQTKLKSIDTDPSSATYGLGVQEVVVDKNSDATVWDALRAEIAQKSNNGQNIYPFDVRRQDVEVKQGTMKLHGEEAFKEAQAQIKLKGGDIWREPTNKNPDRVRYFYPFEGLSNASSKDISARQREIFGEAKKTSKATLEYEVFEKVSKENIENDKEAQQKADKSMAKIQGAMKMITTFLTAILSVAKQILLATLEKAVEVDKDYVEGASLGLTYEQVFRYNQSDIAQGLGKGTTMGAVQSIQSMFGDVTNIDEKALGSLARVMGADVGTFVRSGMGGERPDELLDRILNSYFEQFKQGKNSLGQTVGQEQSRRELVTALNQVSPDIARIFARMTSDYTTNRYGKFGSVSEWREASGSTFRGGVSPADTFSLKQLGENFNSLKASLEGIKLVVMSHLAPPLNNILNRLNNLRIGMSATEKIELDRRNKDNNEKNLNILKTSSKIQEGLIAPFIPKGSPFTAEELVKIAEEDKEYLESKDYKDKMKKVTDKKAFKNFISSLYDNPSTRNAMAILTASYRKRKQIEAENARGVGHDIGYVDVNSMALASIAQAILKERHFVGGKTWENLNAFEKADVVSSLIEFGNDNFETANKRYYHYYFEDNPSFKTSQDAEKYKIGVKNVTQALANKLKRTVKTKEWLGASEEAQKFRKEHWDTIIGTLAPIYADMFHATNMGILVSGDYSGEASYIQKNTVDKAVDDLFGSESLMFQRLSETYGKPFASGKYNYSGGYDKARGEYIIRLIDTQGKEEVITLGNTDFGETKGSATVQNGVFSFNKGY